MNNKVFIKNNVMDEPQIYMDGILIGGYVDVLNMILSDTSVKYDFSGFSREELKLFKSIVKAYNKPSKCFYQLRYLTIVTHNLRYKDTKYYYLDSLSLGNKILKNFEGIDKISLRKIENRYMVIVEGKVNLYGIKNEFGFYDIDNDNFIFNDELENTKRIVINELRKEDDFHFHYVRRKVK